jgi:TetR/AcrR family transcriptional regulator, regulator of cefoperazone and chloramphenicol sensitivity
VNRDQQTRDRLLMTAARLFASRGFRKVTVREICRTARANVASVNYYFGDKLGLYRSVVQAAVDEMRATNEAARAAGEGRPADERLAAFVLVFLTRIAASRDSWIQGLVAREIVDRTGALDLVVERVVRPRAAYLADIVAELLECSPDDTRVTRTVICVQAHCLAFVPNPVSTRMERRLPGSAAEVRELAAQITTFSLAGIQALRETPRARALPKARRR